MASESLWDEGFKAGFEMAVKLSNRRLDRIEEALERAVGWIAGSSNACLSPTEAREISLILHPRKTPEDKP